MVRTLTFIALTTSVLAAQDRNAAVERLLDRIVEREHAFLGELKKHTPLVETYIQEAPGEDARPSKDHYFLGRLSLTDAVKYNSFVERTDVQKQGSRFFFTAKKDGLTFLPRGFAQMAVIDLNGFDRNTYRFEYARREFLGEVRCLVFDVSPTNAAAAGKFVGRIWVEDQGAHIVRFNGTYVRPQNAKSGGEQERYFHFDSWRLNVAPGVWTPAQIYIEESGDARGKKEAGLLRFKAQVRLWDFAAAPASRLDELTNILVESDAPVKDQTASPDVSPLESQRSWERQAEENILARLEKGGLLAPAGAVDEVLNTVVNNLIVTSNLNVEARCRVLLTTPLETFAIGHTIIISRGLLDVLPNEASLAMMLAGELSHIALGHRTQTQFAFHNQTMLSDDQMLEKFRFQRTQEEMIVAGKKTIELMKNSPYQKMANAGLFLKALASRSRALPRLIQANLGNQIAGGETPARLTEFMDRAPALEEEKLDQIAALPLGSRVKLDPWTNRIELVKTRPVSLLSPREKMPFEVTPFVLHLTRVEAGASGKTTAGGND